MCSGHWTLKTSQEANTRQASKATHSIQVYYEDSTFSDKFLLLNSFQLLNTAYMV